jgi:hypothetical protein
MYSIINTSQQTHMKRFNTLLLSSAFLLVLLLGSAAAQFFDEVIALRQELEEWETQNAADFTDVIAQLEDITGPVFQDVSTDAWFNPYVASLAEWNIVSGYKDANGKSTGEFRPEQSVSLAEILKMALEAARVDEASCDTPPVHPVALHHWARHYVSCAEQFDIRLFSPEIAQDLDRPAQRAEVISIVLDAFKEDVLPLYSDFLDTAGHAFEPEIAHAAFYGIVSGDKDTAGNPTGVFRPNDSVNRAEAAKIIYQELKLTTAREEML